MRCEGMKASRKTMRFCGGWMVMPFTDMREIYWTVKNKNKWLVLNQFYLRCLTDI